MTACTTETLFGLSLRQPGTSTDKTRRATPSPSPIPRLPLARQPVYQYSARPPARREKTKTVGVAKIEQKEGRTLATRCVDRLRGGGMGDGGRKKKKEEKKKKKKKKVKQLRKPCREKTTATPVHEKSCRRRLRHSHVTVGDPVSVSPSGEVPDNGLSPHFPSLLRGEKKIEGRGPVCTH